MAQDKRQVDAITARDVDFAQWYTDVCKKAELIDYTSVKGMFIYRPYGYALWENIQAELDRRFKRSVSFQILYFRADQDALAYQDWAEALYDGFRTLEAGGRTVRLKNRSARENGEQRCYLFTFDADLLFWEAVSGETMQTLAQTINDKEG